MTVGRDTITVGTLNIGGLRFPRPPLLPLPARAAELCRRLDDEPIDVLNLQEVFDRSYLRVLRAHLRSYPHVAFRPGLYGPAGGLVTFSRLRLGRPVFRSFLGARATHGGLGFRLGHFVVSAFKGVLLVDLADLPVTVGGTHLSANRDGDWSSGNRHFELHRGELHRLTRALRRPRGTELTVVTGDYNIASDSDHYKSIVDGGALRDPFSATDPTTFHAAFLPDGQPGHRIDYLLVSGDAARFPVLRTATLLPRPVTVAGTDLYLSDHVGLTVQIGLNR